MKQTLFISKLLVSLFLLQGCSQYLHQPLRIGKARLGAETVQFQELTSLPEPKEKFYHENTKKNIFHDGESSLLYLLDHFFQINHRRFGI